MAPVRSKASRQDADGIGSSSRTSKQAAPLASSSKIADAEASAGSSAAGTRARMKRKPYDRHSNPRPNALSLDNLECIRRLGSGTFGQVLLVRVKGSQTHVETHPRALTGAQFAMKASDKKGIRNFERNYKGRISYVLHLRSTERRWLTELPWNPFVCGLVDTFVDRRNLYLLLELAPCISLSGHLKKRGPLPSADVRFYFSNIVLALEFLHSHGIVHRDVKPANILLGADGYLSLTDLGCAAHVTHPHDWDNVGTPDFVAPEVHQQIRTHPDAFPFVDWWAAAVSLYQMAAGRLPFRGETWEEIYDQTVAHNIKWPSRLDIDPDVKDLVTKMLIPKPADRYGCLVVKGEDEEVGKNDEVRAHPFMHRKVQWKKIAERRAAAPYVPMPYPDLAEGWYSNGAPAKEKIPGLHRVPVPIERAWDTRFRRPETPPKP